MKITNVVLFLFFVSNLLAQQGLKVIYNNFSNEITYERNGKEVIDPYVKEGENIYVVLEDFNYYIYKASLSCESKKLAKEKEPMPFSLTNLSAGNTGGGIGGLMNGFNFNVSRTVQGNTTTGTTDTTSVNSKSLGGNDSDAKFVREVIKVFNQLLVQLRDTELALNQSVKNMVLLQNQEKNIRITKIDINTLFKNKYIKPEHIKDLLQKEINDVFIHSEKKSIENSDILKITNNNILQEEIANYQHHFTQLKLIETRFGAYKSRLDKVTLTDTKLDFIRDNILSILQGINTDVRTKDINLLKEEAIAMQPSQDLDFLVQLRTLYQELESTNFTHSFPPIQVADDGQVELELNVRIDSLDQDKTLSQIIPVKGAFRISAGVGLTFSSFTADKYINHRVVNGKIEGDLMDAFTPMVASFVHFFRHTPNKVNIGGSFGIGFPILGGNDFESASFFLGPTLIVGESQRVLLTAGIMGAKIEELSGDLKIGKTFNAGDGSLPTRNAYNTGIFIGLSYNL